MDEITKSNEVGADEFTDEVVAACFACGETPDEVCQICHRAFCDKHSSPHNGKLCYDCINQDNAIITESPLIDKYGNHHRGRRFDLTGEAWMREAVLIESLTDEELTEKIELIKLAIRESENILTFQQIAKGQLHMELGLRESSKRVRLRLLARDPELALNASKAKAKLAASKAKAKKQPSFAQVAASMGLTEAEYLAVVMLLKQQAQEAKPIQ
jgi:hypothetical protein